MKKIIIAMCCLLAMNCFAVEHEVILKEYAQKRIEELGKRSKRVLEVKPLDTEKHGYAVISYQ